MSATIFYSENGELSLPEEPRREGTKYKPVTPGEPLCVEIRRVALGNTEDWMGDSEILASTWAKTGGDAKPAPRILNFYREKLKSYEAISNLGAEHFGHNLIFYSPAYSGETLRMTLEVLEVDQAGDEIVHFTRAICQSLTGLPFFANQLPVLGALSVAPKVAEIGIGLYNLINKNDVLLKADLDLSFERPFETPLNPGRYLFVYGAVAPGSFIKQYRLSPANTLVESDGREAGRKGGVEAPYAVIQITADERKEYAKFQGLSQQQEYMGSVMSRLDQKQLQQIVSVLNPIAEAASENSLYVKILRRHKELEEISDESTRRKLKKQLEGEVSKLRDDELQAIVRRMLQASGALGGSGSSRSTVRAPAKPKASKPAGKTAPKRTTSTSKQNKAELVQEAVSTFSGPFKFGDVRAACPGVSAYHVRRLLRRMRKAGVIRCLGQGRNAEWERTPVLKDNLKP